MRSIRFDRLTIQLAIAFKSGATLAITNDEAWKLIAGIETLLLTDLLDKL
jgi:hypothetical protein